MHFISVDRCLALELDALERQVGMDLFRFGLSTVMTGCLVLTR